MKGCKLHHSQDIESETDKELVIKLNVFLTYDLEKYILSYGNNVKVIDPKKLADKIKTHLIKSN